MAAVQLDLFINEEVERENMQKKEWEERVKRSFRATFYRLGELEETVIHQQKTIDRLLERLN